MKRVLIALLSAFAATATFGSSLDGLVARFTFDGTVADVSGNNLTVDLHDIVLTSDQNGQPLSAASFNGSSSYFTVSGIPVPLNNSFSWSVWVKPSSFNNSPSMPEGTMTPLLQRGVGLGNNSMSPGVWINPIGSVTFYSHDGSTGTAFDSQPGHVAVEAWSHIAVTSTSTGARTIYINGVPVASLPLSAYGFNAELMFVGRDRRFPVFFAGLIDDLRIYNRPLSESEVLAIAKPPTIVGVIPASGPTEGGTRVTISGTNFPSDPVVLIGGVPALEVNQISQTRISAVTPSNQPGMADVTVNGVSENAFYYRPYCGSDLDQNGTVDTADISIILLDFGPCYEPSSTFAAPAPTPLLLPDATTPAPTPPAPQSEHPAPQLRERSS